MEDRLIEYQKYLNTLDKDELWIELESHEEAIYDLENTQRSRFNTEDEYEILALGEEKKLILNNLKNKKYVKQEI